jgi:Zn-dependent protease/CBS domain-containing protein
MFGKRIKLFTLFGFEVGIDLSWIIIAGLITWSLAVGLFPYLSKGLPEKTYWLMGGIGALGLFASIILHEFFHSLVARRFGIPIKGITLFIFGGVAQLAEEPESPKAEFFMAIAGPIASIALAVICYGIVAVGEQSGWPRPVVAVILYLALINGILAVFNLLPAFPLDGGRVLRAFLWWWKGNVRWATRLSSQIGAAFGLVMILLAILQLFRGNFIGALWWFLIGMFLRAGAQTSYQQLLLRQALEGEPVSRFMRKEVITVPPALAVGNLIEDYIYKYHFKMFPVVDGEKLVGCITTREVKEVPKDDWGRVSVGEIAGNCKDIRISPETDAVKALALMNQTGLSRLVVTRGDRLLGIITLKDLLQFFSEKVELEHLGTEA